MNSSSQREKFKNAEAHRENRMLQLRTCCENCKAPLPPQSTIAKAIIDTAGKCDHPERKAIVVDVNRCELKVSNVIGASPPVVWAVLLDVEGWPGWSVSFSEVRRLNPGFLGVGSRVFVKQPKLPRTVWRVTELQPRREFTWVADGPGYSITARHSLLKVGPGTGVTLSIQYDGVLGFLLARWTRRLNETYLAMEANGLKGRCEELTRCALMAV